MYDEREDAMQPELIGGRYRVESVIGRGGMGEVWLCLDETLHRHVAVKQVGLMPGESVTDSARAFREARSSAGLSHPHVVTVFDVVEEAGHIWLVMENVPGRSLSRRSSSRTVRWSRRLSPRSVHRSRAASPPCTRTASSTATSSPGTSFCARTGWPRSATSASLGRPVTRR